MVSILVEKVRGFLANPSAAFRNAASDGPGTVFQYFAVLAVVYAFFSALIAALLPPAGQLLLPLAAGIPLPVAVFLIAFFGAVIGDTIFGAWLHLWVAILGGSRGIFSTIKAVLYGSTPQLLFGWIPVIGFLFTLWSMYLTVVGAHELQGISMARAILAVFIAVMVPVILLILVASYFFITSVTTSAVSIP